MHVSFDALSQEEMERIHAASAKALAILCALLYPVSRERHQALRDQLAAREA